MFYHIAGTVCELSPDRAIIDCNGLGFEVSITPNTASALSLGEYAKLFVTESIGENNFVFYGFPSSEEKSLFKLLTSVSGIGPKAAMSILSYNSPDSVAAAIASGNEAAFTACPGIGKKTAQRLILELKDKIAKDVSVEIRSGLTVPGVSANSSAYEEALTGLSVLGYSTADVVPVLKQINTENMRADEIIRAVLKYMI